MGDLRSSVSTLVLEHGSGVVRCGYGDDNKPRTVLPSVVGRKKGSSTSAQLAKRSNQTVNKKSSVKRPQVLPPIFVPPPSAKLSENAGRKIELGSKESNPHATVSSNIKIGYEALKLRSFFDLENPIGDTGVVANFDDLEEMWKIIYKNVLKGSFFLSNLVLSLPYSNEESTFVTASEILFEKHNVPQLILARDADLAVRFFGLQTGLLVDLGNSSVKCIPVTDKKCAYCKVQSLPFGGQHMAECLANSMSQKGYKFHSQSDSEVLHSLIRDCCYVADDYDSELAKVEPTSNSLYCEKSTELANYDAIKNDMDVESIKIPEMFFQPSLLYGSRNGAKSSHQSLDEIVIETLRTNNILTDESTRVTIALYGGQSAIPNIAQRLQDTLVATNPEIETSVWDVRCLNGSRDASWVAASKIVSHPGTAERFWVRKKEYEDYGPSILSKKWF